MPDFWDIDYLNPGWDRPDRPKPQEVDLLRQDMPLNKIPELDRLFQVQKNALKALRRVQDIDVSSINNKRVLVSELRSLEREIENTYRVIRSWLEKHA